MYRSKGLKPLNSCTRGITRELAHGVDIANTKMAGTFSKYSGASACKHSSPAPLVKTLPDGIKRANEITSTPDEKSPIGCTSGCVFRLARTIEVREGFWRRRVEML